MVDAAIELSVIIPTHNRCATLMRCLRALVAQSLPGSAYEIIVADDGSGDDTEERVNEIARTSAVRVRYLRQTHSGANAARNRAIAEAWGRILLFINDDTIATGAMLADHLRLHERHPAENFAILGRVTISPDVPASIFARLHLDANYGLWEGRKELDWKAFYTCNVSVKKSFLLQHGLFEESIHYHEDLELSERLSHHALVVIYHPEALGHHFHFLSEEDYLAIAEREGMSLSVWHRKSPHLEPVLASLGYYPALPLPKRLKYLVADLVINRATIPFLLVVARVLAARKQDASLILYRKIFQSKKRAAIRKAHRNGD